ncbi:GDSL-like lipase/acylhydrolase family protein [Leeuwenhoekiella aestuarii]|uniref:GDSL-like lipase/acylhydrolase family protein n=1 Tax=Leeuwenhoekiella aestuarii TaxID=2249426 RepID=A0A4V1KP73_9FLAO|nr:SGNH/GDSL hydrolase family protein [Leeuwenhoekiella aestuarii]RXG14077.1 GDSL-like lipase/acylhydrolase family protein [Leeuwenhoekiella aestuarii]RXG18826.1 GDSL-like lipase/acylhydrolase family protein [Leeuwenhoekiella aestuarii]
MKNYIKYMALSAVLLTACEAELDNPIEDGGVYSSGSADFSTFVAVGNSLTSGYADGALYITGQQNSFPKILAGQFALAGGGEFTQPLVDDNTGGLLAGGTQIQPNRFVLALDADGNPGPVRLEGTATTDITNVLSGPFNNMGVPGAKSFHLVAPGYGNIAGVATGASNPYFVRFASATDATVISDAAAQNPTFFSLWIGNNDILSFATSGGTGVDQTGNLDPSTYGANDITDPNVFASVYNSEIQALMASATGGVVFNIPDVTSIPFFTTVPFNAIPLDATTAAGVNQAYAQYNGGLAQYAALGLITAEERDARTINFQEGQNAVVIEDETLTTLPNPAGGTLPNIRQATAADLLLLTTSSKLGTLADPGNPSSVIGVGVALGDADVLIPEEQALIATAQASYNATIQGLTQANGLAFVDSRAILNQLADTGISFDAGTLTSTFATGGAFSLDGVHPTPRGYAYLANQAIGAINTTYGSTIPKVNIGSYGTVNISN